MLVMIVDILLIDFPSAVSCLYINILLVIIFVAVIVVYR